MRYNQTTPLPDDDDICAHEKRKIFTVPLSESDHTYAGVASPLAAGTAWSGTRTLCHSRRLYIIVL